MFCHINYKIDKNYYRKFFWENQKQNMDYWSGIDKTWVWLKDNQNYMYKMCMPILKDLNIEQFEPECGFRYLFQNKRLREHIDIRRVVTILINLQEEKYPKPIMHINGKSYQYESALIDVGTKLHWVEAVNYPRLHLKINFDYGDWKTIFNILDKRGVINHNLTETINPNYKEYESILNPEDEKWVI